MNKLRKWGIFKPGKKDDKNNLNKQKQSWRCSVKKMFSKILHNLQENTYI